MSLSDLNIQLFRVINNLGKEFDILNPVMVFMSKYFLYFLIIGVILLLFSRNHTNKLIVICGTLTFIVSEIIGKLAGMIHSNYQPFVELENVNKLIDKAVGNSFPSDMTILFFSVCITVWLFKRGWSFLWIVLAILLGFSRIWVGVHYPADIIVGAIISIIVALLIYQFVPKLNIVQQFLPNIESKYSS